MAAAVISTSTASSARFPEAAALPPFVLTPAQLAQTFGRTLLLMPHSDDECNVGGLLQYLGDATVLFLTDSAPRDAGYWSDFGSRERYRDLRRQESARSLADLGVNVQYASDSTQGEPPVDQELHLHLPQMLDVVRALVKKLAPKTLLAPAYEGGHPDHDSAAFLAAQIARGLRVQHWETPYYHRTRSGKLKRQTFLEDVRATREVTLSLSSAELTRKLTMWKHYASQSNVLEEFSLERELYRPAPFADFTRPPHNGQLNYEAWQWNARGSELVAKFQTASERQVATI